LRVFAYKMNCMIDEGLIVRAGNQQTEILLNFNWNKVEDLKDSYSQVVLFVDENVLRLFPELEKLGDACIKICEGENSKSWENTSAIIDSLLALELDRDSFFLAVGGGVVTDLVGFIASVYMRGVAFGFVPSTILGAVDASIGGKNGVNHPLAKNMVGTINQPAFVGYDFQLFETLSDEEFLNGLAEVLKYAFSLDIELFYFLYANQLNDLRNNREKLQWMISRCVFIKSQIVESDPFEKDVRKYLNFGHTIGHGIEKITGMKHGLAIVMGMYYETLLSMEFGWVEEDQFELMLSVIKHFGYSLDLSCSTTEIIEKIRMDKKRKGKAIDHIVVSYVGDCRLERIDLEEFEFRLKKLLK
jgi:3-dehydroquinate synthase